jgi:hypothetical protein
MTIALILNALLALTVLAALATGLWMVGWRGVVYER